MYVAVIVSSLAALCFTIVRYVKKRFQRPAGYFVYGTAVLQGILALCYTVQYIWAKNGGTFLSTHPTITLIKKQSEEFPVPNIIFYMWSMMFFFLSLGHTVFDRKFAYEKIRIDAESVNFTP
ncbi:hypothetical protein RF11_06955 [Thelohanellus kitauei]|uniref:Uncharacterized protein n=1 Tax=Thelohanellus kitauei TaxID=669202 RepID=A0A0C2MJY0_THEKT|nr:hypothetical protein RF11_06955 [Thelohanellus kitauei]